jgi:iron complex outermembrane receptor protein
MPRRKITHLPQRPSRITRLVSIAFVSAILCGGLAAGDSHVAATQSATRPATQSSGSDFELTLQTTKPARSRETDLTGLSLEDLMNLQVTSVSKQSQRIANAPAAVYVITSEDIAHSGMTSIPDLLRLSPGLEVARVTASSWAITSRGFNSTFANKLQVLMDGRTLYTPFFSGTFWADQDYVLQDLDRIEVIRGPGATLWGANAVNGVINITTKDARDTQGWLADGLGGNVEQQGAIRYGGQLDERTYYRVYAKYKNTDNFYMPGVNDDAGDGWDSLRSGFRIDRHTSDHDHFTLQGDIYRNPTANVMTFPISAPPFSTTVHKISTNEGENILARWTHVISDESDFSLQLYYNRILEGQVIGRLDQRTVDLDFQHRFPLGKRQEIVWGAGYRFIANSVDQSDVFRVQDPDRKDYLASAFVQDAITLVPDHWTFFIGSKFEVGSLSDFEVQPSARLLWTPNDRNSFWGAVSRAVRTPSQTDEDSRISVQRGAIPPGIPFTSDVFSSPDNRSEELTAYELGYRVKVNPALSFDLATFFNNYRSLHTTEPGAPVPDPEVPGRILIPLVRANKAHGESYGVELASNWNVTDAWRLTASYTFLELFLHTSSSSADPSVASAEGMDPQNQFQIHSTYNITRHLTFDASGYYVDRLTSVNVDGYFRLDLGLTWRPNPGFQLSAWVQNLLDNRHAEFGGEALSTASEVPRSFYIEATWRY